MSQTICKLFGFDLLNICSSSFIKLNKSSLNSRLSSNI